VELIMKRVALLVSILVVVFATSLSAQIGRDGSVQPPAQNVFWIAYPFTTFAPAVANYAEAPAGSLAPFATGDVDYHYVVIHRVVADFTSQPGPYWTDVAPGCPYGRVVTSPDGVTISLRR